jgi:hypothetical protein
MPLILIRHVMPNTFAPMIVQATFVCASAILIEAILSFLGIGIPTDIPTWGNIMAEGLPAHHPVSRRVRGHYRIGREHARRRSTRCARPAHGEIDLAVALALEIAARSCAWSANPAPANR